MPPFATIKLKTALPQIALGPSRQVGRLLTIPYESDSSLSLLSATLVTGEDEIEMATLDNEFRVNLIDNLYGVFDLRVHAIDRVGNESVAVKRVLLASERMVLRVIQQEDPMLSTMDDFGMGLSVQIQEDPGLAAEHGSGGLSVQVQQEPDIGIRFYVERQEPEAP